jgi:hypothetical protein
MTDALSKLRWAPRQRLAFIRNQLATAGRLNRADLMAEFGISEPQASLDLRQFLTLFPGVMRYDVSRKAYVPTSEAEADG